MIRVHVFLVKSKWQASFVIAVRFVIFFPATLLLEHNPKSSLCKSDNNRTKQHIEEQMCLKTLTEVWYKKISSLVLFESVDNTREVAVIYRNRNNSPSIHLEIGLFLA